jgi:hypothetical protein
LSFVRVAFLLSHHKMHPARPPLFIYVHFSKKCLFRFSFYCCYVDLLRCLGCLVKGIASRDFLLYFSVSFDRSEVPTHTGRVRLLLKLEITSWCRIFRFSRLGVVSLPCEWGWHLGPVRGSKARYCSIGFTLEIKKEHRIIVRILSPVLQEPRSGALSSLQIFSPNQHLHDISIGLPVRGNDRSCGKSHSPPRLTG